MRTLIILSFILLVVSQLHLFAAQDATEQPSDLLNVTDISTNDTDDANATLSNDLDEAVNTTELTDFTEAPVDSLDNSTDSNNSTDTENEAVESETTDEPDTTDEPHTEDEAHEGTDDEEHRRALYRNQTASEHDQHQGDHEGERQAESDDERRQAYEEAVRQHEERRRQYEEEEARRRAEYPVQYTQPVYAAPGQDPYEQPPPQYNQGYEDIPTKTSVQATFKFTSEERCLNFLRRLKSKGRNEHSDHPLSCPPVFDGILCWRSADPGETILQVCPDVPRQSQIYAKRECVNGQWRDYPYANQRLQHNDIRQSYYDDCYQLPQFMEKHGHSDYQSTGGNVPNYISYPGVMYPTPDPAVAYPEQSTLLYSYVTAPSQPAYTGNGNGDGDDMVATTVVSSNGGNQDWNVIGKDIPPRPWLIADGTQCRDFLHSHNLDNTRDGTWCPGTSDGRFCWPASPPGYVAHQPCRALAPGEDSQHVPAATRQCSISGEWNTTAADGATHLVGHTDLSACGLLQVAAVTPSQPNNDIHIAGLAGSGVVLNLRETTLMATTEVTTDSNAGSTMAQIANGAGRDTPKQPWQQSTPAGCETFLKEIAQWEGEAGSCRGGTDGKICWPTTPKDKTITQPCPPHMCLDTTRTVSRTCGANGAWTTPTGNYEACFTQDAKDLINMHYSPKTSSATNCISQATLPLILAFFVTLIMFV